MRKSFIKTRIQPFIADVMSILENILRSLKKSDELFTLERRITQLEEAIRKHKSNTGNNLCWENDIELWSVLGEAKYPHDTLLPEEVFLKNCKNYYKSRKLT
jgi:hypothetical protein